MRKQLLSLILLGALLLPQVRLQSAEEELPGPAIAETIIEILKRFYYDHDRFHPRLMLERSLRAMESSEMSLEVHLEGTDIHFNFAGHKQIISVKDPQSLSDLMMIMQQILQVVSKHEAYTNEQRSTVLYAMFNGALQTLDPHTLVFPPKPASEFTDDLQGEFFGIGAYLSQEDGVVKIDRVMPGRPAEEAGVRNGDKIIQIDGEKTAGLSLSESVSRIKGPRGTKVTLTIERAGKDEPLKIVVTRDLVRIEILRAFRSGDIAYVRLDEFNKNADRMLRNVLYEWDRDVKNPVMGLVLDLRFNGGGRLDKARIISDMFLSSNKEIVRTVSKGKKPFIQYSSKDNISILDVPMMVMVSPSSASAAEILAGALQQNKRAVVVGRTSYGKGSVQQYRPLQNKSIFKFTVQEYQLKDGVSIQGVGITPDVELLRHSVDEDGKVDLMPFTRSSEADAEFALKSHDTYKHQSTFHLSWLAEYEDIDDMRLHYISAGEAFKPDQEAQLVIDVLQAGLQSDIADEVLADLNMENMAPSILRLLKPAIAKRHLKESEDLAQALDNYGAVKTWGLSEDSVLDQLSLEFVGPKELHPGSKEELVFKVVNPSEAAVGRLFAVIRRDKDHSSSPFWEEEILFGEVAAQSSVEGSMGYRVPPRLYSGEERFTVDLYQQGRKAPINSTEVIVKITPSERPHFNFSWSLESADGKIVKDRESQLVITLRNDGKVRSGEITMLMSKADNRFIQLGEGRWKLDALDAGAEHQIKVPFTVLSTLAMRTKKLVNKEDSVDLEFFAEERFDESGIGQYRENISYTFTLPLNQAISGGHHQKPRLIIHDQNVANNVMLLAVHVEDDNLDFLTVFQGKDKVALHTADEIVDGMFKVKLNLRKGLNNIQLLVRDKDELVQYLPVRYWAPGAPAETTAALPKSDEEQTVEDIP